MNIRTDLTHEEALAEAGRILRELPDDTMRGMCLEGFTVHRVVQHNRKAFGKGMLVGAITSAVVALLVWGI